MTRYYRHASSRCSRAEHTISSLCPTVPHISAYVDSFNADNATLLVIIKSGAMRRNALRSLLRGIYADKVVTAILR